MSATAKDAASKRRQPVPAKTASKPASRAARIGGCCLATANKLLNSNCVSARPGGSREPVTRGQSSSSTASSRSVSRPLRQHSRSTCLSATRLSRCTLGAACDKRAHMVSTSARFKSCHRKAWISGGCPRTRRQRRSESATARWPGPGWYRAKTAVIGVGMRLPTPANACCVASMDAAAGVHGGELGCGFGRFVGVPWEPCAKTQRPPAVIRDGHVLRTRLAQQVGVFSPTEPTAHKPGLCALLPPPARLPLRSSRAPSLVPFLLAVKRFNYLIAVQHAPRRLERRLADEIAHRLLLLV